MEESRDPSRTARIDWTGAALAVLGLGGIVFGFLEWPPLGATPSARARRRSRSGACSLVLLVQRGASCAESDAAAHALSIADLHARQRSDAAAVRGAGRGHVSRAAEPDSGPALHGNRGGSGAAAVSADHVCAVAMVGRPGRADRQPAAADGRTRRSPRSASRSTRGRASADRTGRRFFRRSSCWASAWRSRSRR